MSSIVIMTPSFSLILCSSSLVSQQTGQADRLRFHFSLSRRTRSDSKDFAFFYSSAHLNRAQAHH